MDVIDISSGSDGDDSDVEIVGSYGKILTRDDPLPLSAVRVDVNALKVNVPPHYTEVSNSRWTSPEMMIGKRLNYTSFKFMDLTEDDITTEKLTQDAYLIKKDCTDDIQNLNKQIFYANRSTLEDPLILTRNSDCGILKPKHHVDSQIQTQKQIDDVSLTSRQLLEIGESHDTELRTINCLIHLSEDHRQTCAQSRLRDDNREEPKGISDSRTTTTSNHPYVEPSLDESLSEVTKSLVKLEQKSSDFTTSQINGKIFQYQQDPTYWSDKESSFTTFMEHISREEEMEDDYLSTHISLASSSLSQDKAHHCFQGQSVCSSPEQLELNQTDSGQTDLSDQPSPLSPILGLQPTEPLDVDCLSYTSHNSEHSLLENESEMQLKTFKREEASNSPYLLLSCRQSETNCKVKDQGNRSRPKTMKGDKGNDSPIYLWQEWGDGDQVNADRQDRHFVCPVTLRKIMDGPTQTLIYEEDEGIGMPELLCRQSLSLVYSTIDEHYTEGTLQLLSDLLQPGYSPPKDITHHVLHDILLNPQCPYHLSLQAFNLLIRTQRHRMADRTNVPWDWDLLTLVIDNQEQIQDQTKRLRCEVVRMFFDYVLKTLEDDFQAKHSISALHQSIAKATLSCGEQFSRVRDVVKWLFSAIMKSTVHEDSKAERDEQIRMVSILQRMLSLALEVDRSPALNSAQLSQELFLMLIGKMHLRAHRMLLLESLQSKLVRCKLLEQLLDYSCPVKTCLPMSLSLLLHYMQNCTLASDPADGTERWQKWEELVHLLWMLLLSYNKAMKGCLYSSVTERRSRVGTLVYKQDDRLTKPAVCEAVETFLSRTQEDLGRALPLHIEESLTYLQDHLLDVCQF
ncbi:uncharacterized protein simc1 [Antennarius striatus]|uniref:uncharacterized protein simc1 n=1 Tax=Antennarius striatus TaxID=241820 RepID=UPI0035B4F6AA